MVHRRAFCALVAAAAFCFPAGAQKKQRKPDIEILKVSSTRQEGKIAYEGALKVSGEKPVVGLILHFEFFESRGVLLSMQKIQVEDATLMPGEEREFHVQGNDVPRAVRYRLSATDASNRDLSVAGGGPYPLD